MNFNFPLVAWSLSSLDSHHQFLEIIHKRSGIFIELIQPFFLYWLFFTLVYRVNNVQHWSSHFTISTATITRSQASGSSSCKWFSNLDLASIEKHNSCTRSTIDWKGNTTERNPLFLESNQADLSIILWRR